MNGGTKHGALARSMRRRRGRPSSRTASAGTHRGDVGTRVVAHSPTPALPLSPPSPRRHTPFLLPPLPAAHESIHRCAPSLRRSLLPARPPNPCSPPLQSESLSCARSRGPSLRRFPRCRSLLRSPPIDAPPSLSLSGSLASRGSLPLALPLRFAVAMPPLLMTVLTVITLLMPRVPLRRGVFPNSLWVPLASSLAASLASPPSVVLIRVIMVLLLRVLPPGPLMVLILIVACCRGICAVWSAGGMRARQAAGHVFGALQPKPATCAAPARAEGGRRPVDAAAPGAVGLGASGGASHRRLRARHMTAGLDVARALRLP